MTPRCAGIRLHRTELAEQRALVASQALRVRDELLSLEARVEPDEKSSVCQMVDAVDALLCRYTGVEAEVERLGKEML